MQQSEIKAEIKNYKIREGYLYKRSKYIQQWRKRWIIITMNFIFTFQTHTCQRATSIIAFRDVLSLTSQVQKSQDFITNGFVITTNSHNYAFCSNEVSQKWSWIVTIERIMDFREKGASNYNSLDQITTQGFQSHEEYLFRKKLNIVNKNYSTLSLQQEQKKNLMNADEILKRLIDQKQILQKREESLKRRQMQVKNQAQNKIRYQQEIKILNKQIVDAQNQLKTVRKQRDKYRIIHVEFYEAVEKVINRWSQACNKQTNEELLLSTVQILNIFHRNNKKSNSFLQFQKTITMSTINLSDSITQRHDNRQKTENKEEKDSTVYEYSI